jgi:hypothetical protein
MLSDKSVNDLKIVQTDNVHIDGNIVNIMGKVGETTNLYYRIKTYKNGAKNKRGMW